MCIRCVVLSDSYLNYPIISSMQIFECYVRSTTCYLDECVVTVHLVRFLTH